MGALDGKVAVVTGGSLGIGLATAARFAAEGAHVFITGRRKDHLDDALAAIGHGVTAVRADAASLDDLDRLYACIASEAGRLDIVVANAAVRWMAPFDEVTVEDFDAMYDADVRGAFFTVQKALPLLADDSSVVLIGSGAWRQGKPGSSVYASAKAALRSFARTWTSDLKHRRIRVNVVSPGVVDSGAAERNLSSAEQAEAHHRAGAEATPLGRLGRPEEIASAILFLASDQSSFITGIDMPVDGGLTAV
jgi:NAD(P)-dependent dehydrogenase (short-subunit alcohol dehydrogenase family)